MEKRHQITICMGSSCFARGNKKIVKIIQEFISRNKLDQQIVFKGNHCFGMCKEGPILQINESCYKGITEEGIIEILEKELKSAI